ncbi:MAG: ROK family protein [Ilumatobacteraceae bacterium]
MNADRRLIVAVDIGGTRMSAGLMTLRGDLIDRTQAPVDQAASEHELFDALVGLVDDMLVRADEHHHLDPIAIGVGCAGPLTADVESVSPANLSMWHHFPLRARLEAAVSLPVYGGLDATSLALAEGWLGAAQGRSNFLAVVVSSGVSGAIVLDGQLVEGATGGAGQIGHVVVEPNGRRCSCGARGCLDAEASGRSIEAITGRPPTEPSYEIMQRTGELVGRAVASSCNLLDLDLVVVGGQVALGFGATFFNGPGGARSPLTCRTHAWCAAHPGSPRRSGSTPRGGCTRSARAAAPGVAPVPPRRRAGGRRDGPGRPGRSGRGRRRRGGRRGRRDTGASRAGRPVAPVAHVAATDAGGVAGAADSRPSGAASSSSEPAVPAQPDEPGTSGASGASPA